MVLGLGEKFFSIWNSLRESTSGSERNGCNYIPDRFIHTLSSKWFIEKTLIYAINVRAQGLLSKYLFTGRVNEQDFTPVPSVVNDVFVTFY
jgi:hypothetical protein